MTYKNFFDGVFFINMDHRTDRLQQITAECERLDIPAQRFPGVVATPHDIPKKWIDKWASEYVVGSDEWDRIMREKSGEIGCAQSHLEVIQHAKEQQLDNVLVFEDDAVFLDTWKTHIDTVVEELSRLDNTWDMVYFGGELPGTIHKTNTDQLIPVSGGIYCLHAYAVNARFYDQFLAHDPDYVLPIDCWLLSVPSNTFVVTDIMVVQRNNTHSDILHQPTSLTNETALAQRWKERIILP
jgi:GR25 family glycosyltransferase involved in LPS biosynthesis